MSVRCSISDDAFQQTNISTSVALYLTSFNMSDENEYF